MNRLDDIDTPHQAEFERRYRHIFQHRTCGLDDDVLGHRNQAGDIDTVLYRQAGDHRAGMAALAVDSLDIGGNAGAASRVMPGKT